LHGPEVAHAGNGGILQDTLLPPPEGRDYRVAAHLHHSGGLGKDFRHGNQEPLLHMYHVFLVVSKSPHKTSSAASTAGVDVDAERRHNCEEATEIRAVEATAFRAKPVDVGQVGQAALLIHDPPRADGGDDRQRAVDGGAAGWHGRDSRRPQLLISVG